MQIGSSCSGPCVVCQCAGGCLAGHGDDDFVPIPVSDIREMIKTNYHKRWSRQLFEYEWRQADAYLTLNKDKLPAVQEPELGTMKCRFKQGDGEILEGELLYIKESRAMILVDVGGRKRSCDIPIQDLIAATGPGYWGLLNM